MKIASMVTVSLGTAILVAACGGGGSSPAVSPLPAAQLTGINLSQSALTLDRWGASATISAQAVDQNGANFSGATISWSSPDANIASVDSAGEVTSWMAGTVDLTVEASAGGTMVTEAVAVTVAVQQNANCQVPTEFPVKGPVAPPANWVIEEVDTQFPIFRPDGSLAFDMDVDGDTDLLLSHTSGGHFVPSEGPPEQRVWLNDGAGIFVDGTDTILNGATLPLAGIWEVRYRDFTGDGIEDALIIQTGTEFAPCDAGIEGACAGEPHVLLVPQLGAGVLDLAPSNLIPYEPASFSYSGDAADVDCDGDYDFFVGDWTSDPEPVPNHLFINDGGGTFIAEDFRMPAYPTAVSGAVFCDLDRDGDQDFVMAGAGNQNSDLRILINDGFGSFRQLNQEPPANPAWKLRFRCGDVDLNGFPDLFITNEANAFGETSPVWLQIFLNNGDMIFQDATDSLLPPGKIVPYLDRGIVDLNSDGWLDIFSEGNPNPSSVLWNTGGGIFVWEFLPAEGDAVSIADFDGNGRLDMHWDRVVEIDTNPDSKNIFLWNR